MFNIYFIVFFFMCDYATFVFQEVKRLKQEDHMFEVTMNVVTPFMRNGLLLTWERGLNEGSKLRYHQCWTCELCGGVSDRNMGERLPTEIEMTQLHQQSPLHHGDILWKLEPLFKAVQFISTSPRGSLAYLSISLSRSYN